MSYRDFDEFLIRLEQDDHVESVGDVGGKHASRRRGRTPVAVYVDQVSGAKIVQHAFATRRRVAWALQVERITEVASRLDRMLDLSKPHTFSSLMDRASDIMSSLRIMPSVRRRTNSDLQSIDVKTVHRVASVTDEPLVGTVFLERDNRPYWGVQVVPGNFVDSVLVQSPHRLDVGESVAVTLGGDPGALIAALMPLPSSVHRSYFTGWLRKRPLETVRLDDPPVDVPVNVDGVLVGTVERVEAASHAFAFPEKTQYAASVAVRDVRLNPNAVLVSLSERDATVLSDAMIEISLPLIRLAVPEMRAVSVHGGVARIEVDGDESAALRSAYTFLASPFADNVRWIVTTVSGDDNSRVLPDALVLQRKATVAHPEHGRSVTVFVAGKSPAKSTNAAAWMPEYELAVTAWRDASDRLEE
ncbi:MAG: UbiD family decarboxylase [Chloroflexi bacterium]|nr:UbiD family decarboxylase [Chloroflexota bacterium]